MDINKIIARVKAILLTPKTEWPVIAGEPETVADLFKNYILILAAIPAVCGFLGMVRFVGLNFGLYSLILGYVLSLVSAYLLALVIDALAPSFDGQKNFVQALKTVAYSFTAGWIAGVAQIVPLLGSLIALLGLFYGIYLLYVGLPVTMKCPPEKSAGYTAVSVIVAIVLYLVVGFIVAGATGMHGMRSGGMFSRSNDTQTEFPKDSPLGKMQEFGKNIEQATRKMEVAQKSGDQTAQADAIKSMMGAALGGGNVESLAPDRLKPFIPESLAGMARKDFSAERNNALGMQISEARGTFTNEAGRSVRLEITDSGTAKGLLGLAGWAGVEGEKQSDSGYEKTYRSDGRLIHEEWHGTQGEYTVVVADRFMVKLDGEADSIDQLKAAVGDLDLSGLEDLKDAGVPKE